MIRRQLIGAVTVAATVLVLPAAVHAQERQAVRDATLTPTERTIVEHIDAHRQDAVALLERVVNINSGTLNVEGQRRVAEVFAAELEPLGFEVRYEELPDSLNRGGHLIAERRGDQGRHVLLIGHLDTVFEEDSPFQRFELLNDSVATGSGLADMKGGDVVIVQALEALAAADAL
ncbi:MAG: hypothetical protein ACOC8B_06000, partial [Gemmatimonadota bacterium]